VTEDMSAIKHYKILTLLMFMFVSRRVNSSKIANDDGCLTNDGGYKCKSPFSYDGKEYYECTKAGGYKTPWCYDVSGSWDYCSNCVQSYEHWPERHCYGNTIDGGYAKGYVTFDTLEEAINRCNQVGECNCINHHTDHGGSLYYLYKVYKGYETRGSITQEAWVKQ